MKEKVPIQSINEDVPLQIIRMNDFFNDSSFTTHRHAFFMLMWATEGLGEHRINYRAYELKPGNVFFTHEGQIHQMIHFPKDGWIVIFKHQLFQQYINRYPEQEQSGPFDFFTSMPYAHLDESLLKHFNQIVSMLQEQTFKQQTNRLLINYLSILLFYIHQAYTGKSEFVAKSFQTEQLRKLKLLIDKYYKVHRNPPFYSKQLGLSTRKLNEITNHILGKLVQDMILDRVLSECEMLLGGTNLSMKEIIFELGFLGHSHFSYFFKKAKGVTPSAFRQIIQK